MISLLPQTHKLTFALALAFFYFAVTAPSFADETSDTQAKIDFLKHSFDFKPIAQEGGYYFSTYHSSISLPSPVDGTPRDAGSAIYFLMGPGDFSAMHQLKSDEIYHFYTGSPTEMLLLNPDGTGRVVICGPDIWKGEEPQIVVAKGTWQGSHPLDPKGLSLLGTTMTPGFAPADFTLGKRDDLIKAYPKFAGKITALTRQ